MSGENKIKVVKQNIELEILESQLEQFIIIGYTEKKEQGSKK